MKASVAQGESASPAAFPTRTTTRKPPTQRVCHPERSEGSAFLCFRSAGIYASTFGVAVLSGVAVALVGRAY